MVARTEKTVSENSAQVRRALYFICECLKYVFSTSRDDPITRTQAPSNTLSAAFAEDHDVVGAPR